MHIYFRIRDSGALNAHYSDFPYAKHAILHSVKALSVQYDIHESLPILQTPRNDPFYISSYYKEWQWIRSSNADNLYNHLKDAVVNIIKLDETDESSLINDLNDRLRLNKLNVYQIKQRIRYYFEDPDDKYVSSMLSMFLPDMTLFKWRNVIKYDYVYPSLAAKRKLQKIKICVPFWSMKPKEQESLMKYITYTPLNYNPFNLYPYNSLLDWVSSIDSVYKYVLCTIFTKNISFNTFHYIY